MIFGVTYAISKPKTGNFISYLEQNKSSSNLLKIAKSKLFNHPIYESIQTVDDMKIFMESHVWAVFDFMTLLKRLERDYTNVEQVWTPRKSADMARFIGEICLGEESDELPYYLSIKLGQSYISHYELYLLAMKEIGADTSKIEEFISLIDKRKATMHDLIRLTPSDQVAYFVTTNFFIANSETTLGVASTFFFGREDPIPLMFMRFLESVPDSDKLAYFKYYLERHIVVDADNHGPKSMELLESLVNDDEEKMEECLQFGISAIDARINLWTDIVERINERKNNLKFDI